jgi:hypothetical protein
MFATTITVHTMTEEEIESVSLSLHRGWKTLAALTERTTSSDLLSSGEDSWAMNEFRNLSFVVETATAILRQQHKLTGESEALDTMSTLWDALRRTDQVFHDATAPFSPTRHCLVRPDKHFPAKSCTNNESPFFEEEA